MNIVCFEKDYSYCVFVKDAIELSRQYAPFLRLESIGTSLDNREILLFRLGEGNSSVLFTGGVHGRENINPIVLLRIIEDLCKDYFGKRNLLSGHIMLFVPILNPDGYEIAGYGYEAVKNPIYQAKCRAFGIPAEEYKYNAGGVDINRNFPCSSYLPFRHTGNMPGTEPETKAFMQLVQSENTRGYIDFHSRGNCIYYYRKAMSQEYNQKQKRIAEALGNVCGYRMVKPEEEIEAGDSGGNTVHFYSEYTKNPAITVETVADEENFPLGKGSFRTGLYHGVYTAIRQLPMDFLNIVC